MGQFKNGNTSFFFQDPRDYERLKGVFEAAGYNNAGVLETVGVKNAPTIKADDVPLLVSRTNRGTPLDTLIRLFLIEVPCATEAVERAVQPMNLETLARAGLIEIHQNSVTAAVKVLPFNNLVVIHDRPKRLQSALRHDHVIGIGTATLTLAGLTVRRHVGTTLDLGTGCGVLALLAAQHSDRVLAVDLNPRAVQFAEFNAKLNGLSHIECREGDFFHPVKGEKFDLVITNPPFVISPENRYIYRDGGMESDQVCEMIVREVPAFLEEGGYCQILGNWAKIPGEDWQDRLGAWFEGTGCDVWVVRFETMDPETYASTWIRQTEKSESEQSHRRFEKWKAYYEQHDIEAISIGLITMRRVTKPVNWHRFENAPKTTLPPCGDHILRGFALKDFLETVQEDSALLSARLCAAPDVRLERHYTPSAEGWSEATIQIHVTKAFCYSADLDTHVADLVLRCDGRTQLKELLDQMAGSLGRDAAEITPAFCTIVRGLIERGYLVPPQFID